MAKGIAAGAAVLYDESGTELAIRARFLVRVTTPIAEYMALHTGLQLAAEHAYPDTNLAHVLALGDAELVVRQVNKRYQCLKPHLRMMLDMTYLLMAPFASCEVREFPRAGPLHKRRYGNARADELATMCMKEGVDLDG